jgi:[ribosomal protein S18]-alanine N-acetyltransferase
VTRAHVLAATAADAESIAAADAACFAGAAWTPPQVESELLRAGAIALVLRNHDAVLGYALGWCLAAEGELLRIAVMPSARGVGHGATLLQAFQRASEADALFLEVNAENTAARSLYSRNGWLKVGVRRAYYRNGDDAVLMAWRTA